MSTVLFFCVCVVAQALAQSGGDDGGLTHCSLEWTSVGYGALPPHAVTVDTDNPKIDNSPGSEYVGRVLHQNRQWELGRLTTNLDSGGAGVLQVISTNPWTSPTYQVLSNPAGCILQWNGRERNPVNAVQFHQEQTTPKRKKSGPAYTIGRTKYAGGWIAGLITTTTEHSSITFTYNGNTFTKTDVEAEGGFEVLTSSFEQLSLKLSDFAFNPNWAVIAANTSKELVGESWIQGFSDMDQAGDIGQVIRHERPLVEKITIHGGQTQAFRCNVERVQVHMELWYGGAQPIVAEFLIHDRDDSVSVNRTIVTGTSSDVRFLPSERGPRLLHIVSTATIFKGHLPFRANAVFTGRHATRLVSECGLRIMSMDDLAGIVHASVEGYLSGVFVIGTETSVSNS